MGSVWSKLMTKVLQAQAVVRFYSVRIISFDQNPTFLLGQDGLYLLWTGNRPLIYTSDDETFTNTAAAEFATLYAVHLHSVLQPQGFQFITTGLGQFSTQ